jgi:hypothetical protein
MPICCVEHANTRWRIFRNFQKVPAGIQFLFCAAVTADQTEEIFLAKQIITPNSSTYVLL